MNLIESKRLSVLETNLTRKTLLGPMECVVFNVWRKDEPLPVMLTASGMLVKVGQPKSRWLLSHVMVEDEDRRLGIATEIVLFYEDRLGEIDACWASDTGAAFAQRYIERHGPRPHWRVGVSEEVEKLRQRMNGKAVSR